MREFLNTAALSAQKSVIREYGDLAKKTPGCIALTLGEPDFDTPAVVEARVQDAFEAGETHYIANNGSMELRKKIAAWEAEKNGMDYTPEEVVITAGATQALFSVLFGILNPGDEVIVPTPAFVLYESITSMCRGKFVALDTTEDEFQVTAEKLLPLINERTKAIVLNTPNNPTGCILSEESLQVIHDAVKDKPIFVICDDVYRQLVYSGTAHSFTEFKDMRKQTILIQSFSKPYAMTGWRMGYFCADIEVMERLELVHQYMVTSTPAPFQRACMEALDFDPKDMLAQYAERRAFVLKRMEEIGMDCTRPDGAFYVFPSIEKYGLSSADFCKRMIVEAGLAVTPGFCFCSDKHIRISYCCSMETLVKAMDRLEKFVGILKEEGRG